jgi:pimeloyl-ACP methyl ester carboxylesterase
MRAPAIVTAERFRMHQVCSGSGDHVLFLHGMPTSCHLWDRVIGQLSGRFTCLAVDLPGLGRSPRLSRGFRDLSAIVTAVEDLRIERGIEKWHIVGHDAGCAIVVEYAHRYPENTARLALLTPSIFPDLRPFYLFDVLRKPVLGELMAPAINILFWKIVMRVALEGNTDIANDDMVHDFHAPFHGITGAWRLMSLLRWGNPTDVLASMPARLSELISPTLIFHGNRDSAVPAAFATRAAGLLRDSEVIFLDSGHFLPICESAIIARELERFFTTGRAMAQLAPAGD